MNLDKFVEDCYNALTLEHREKPWLILNHGTAVLGSEEQLNAYIAAYGEMHITKCRMAMQNFPFEELVKLRTDSGEIAYLNNFEIYDWGCGQGLGSLVLLQMLSERGMLHGLKQITLIEPSSTALSRAEHFIRQATNPSTEIRTINRFIPSNDQPLWKDLECHNSIAIHIFSNILDIREVGLGWLSKTTANLGRLNFYICVGPRYSGLSRISDFYNYFGKPSCFADFSRYPCSYTTRTKHPYGIEAKCFTLNPTDKLNLGYVEASKQEHLDEYQSGDECLKGILPDPLINAYHNLREAAGKSSFELFLRPSIGIERPDMVMTNMYRGIIIVNVCENITNFAKDFDRVCAIKQALFDTYIKSLKIDSIITPTIYNVIKIGLYFTNATSKEIEEQCNSYYKEVYNEVV